MNTQELNREIELLLKADKLGSNNAGRLFDDITFKISKEISKAIGTVSPLTAPFVIVILRQYADAITGMYPGIQDAVDETAQIMNSCSEIHVQQMEVNRD